MIVSVRGLGRTRLQPLKLFLYLFRLPPAGPSVFVRGRRSLPGGGRLTAVDWGRGILFVLAGVDAQLDVDGELADIHLDARFVL